MQEHQKAADFSFHSESPLNGGTSPTILRQWFVTPVEHFFIRNHGNVPQVDLKAFRLKIDGLVERPLSLTVGELRDQFTVRTALATLQCAGNRRDELIHVSPIPGETPWGAEAVGTAEWTGVSLRDVLEQARIKPEAEHVAFSGLDDIEKEGDRFKFGGSIPIDKAFQSEVLLACEMNGAPLTPFHGFPLRLVVPGYIGARSVKWLGRITLQREPSRNYYQVKAYRMYPPDMRQENVVWEKGIELGEFPVNVVICRPTDGTQTTESRIPVQGYALAGGGRLITRIDISSNGGQTWQQAQLDKAGNRWTWRFWEAEVELGAGTNQIVARGWDSAVNTQPETPASVWNFKGYMNNCWHRITIRRR
ncbi:MAG TPA: sulfite oxidase [Acidobacteriota bacterium]|nr:sulfite oxidase [Acidobacteriota bacterium]